MNIDSDQDRAMKRPLELLAATTFVRITGAEMDFEFGANANRGLTESQQAAVEHFEGPLLVLAGPGSGKTRVITRRIARLVERGVHSRSILAITFTNKAAREMAERVEQLLPEGRVWVSTFHRLCARLLRQYGQAVGLQPNYTIYDTTDQRQLIRHVMSELELSTTHYPPASIAASISKAKNRLETPEALASRSEGVYSTDLATVTARVYAAYQKALLAANAVDFDDLLLHVANMLRENPELRADLDERYRYILVDEYQDTNLAQYQIVVALSADHPNLCVTGDPDQSIYGWRGAEIGNILRFERDFPNTKVVRLEQNFRSTKEILKSADALIVHNVKRKAKALFTDNDDGKPVELFYTENSDEEADAIARWIRKQVEEHDRNWSDFAILYRVNALSRRLEISCLRHRIPCQIAAGPAFYDRAEIKDLLCYLRLVENPRDLTAFQRVVNSPTRGIGKQTQARLLNWATYRNISPLEACDAANEIPALNRRAILAAQRFGSLMREFALADSGSVADLLSKIIDRTKFGANWEYSKSEDDVQRKANVEELIAAARHYDEDQPDDPTLGGFLETTSLTADVDSLDENSGRVTLMTLHAAKGLEFPVVIVLAVEHRLLPHERALRDDTGNEMEEERRLLFVGMTRAQEELYLTLTGVRDLHGRADRAIPSTFLSETKYIQTNLSGGGSAWPIFSSPRSKPAKNPIVSEPFMTAQPTSAASLRNHPLLTTGAKMLKEAEKKEENAQAFTVGMLVRHPRMGLGRVVELGTSLSRATVTVEFETGELTQYIVSKCPLQPVGAG